MKKGDKVRIIDKNAGESYHNGDEAEYTGNCSVFRFENGDEYGLYPCEYEVINKEPTISDIMEELGNYGDGTSIKIFGDGSGVVYSDYDNKKVMEFSRVIDGYNWLKEQNSPTLTLSNGKKVSEKLVKELMEDYEKRNK